MLSASWHSAGHLQPRSTSATLGLYVPSRTTVLPKSMEANTGYRDPFVFEDQSDDYASVIRESPVRPPSTLSLIQTRLPPQLPQPSINDTSIFEDPSGADYASLIISKGYTPSSLFQTFSQLIFAKRFDEAHDLLMEIQSSDIEIPISHIWELPAQAAITTPSIDLETQISRFNVWFNLVPPKHLEDFHRRFRRSRRLVFQSLHANIPLAIRFSLILASKGYATTISRDAIPFIMRFAPPATGLQFVKDFEKTDMIYATQLHRTPSDLEQRQATLMGGHVRGPAVDVLARSNHLEEAVSLLPDSAGPKFKLSIRTYDLLLSRLRQSKNPDVAKYIPHVETLRQDPVYSTFLDTGRRTKYNPNEADAWDAGAMNSVDLKALDMEANPESDKYIGEFLALELRSLIDAVQSPSTFPPTADLVVFMQKYLDKGRTAAIVRLRRLALNAHASCGSLFLQAEMTYYLAQGLPILVLRSFADHFHMAGVPQDEVIAGLSRFERNRSYDYLKNNEHPAFAAIQTKSMRKLWPARAHSNLVWQALVKLTPSDEGVEMLYQKLLQSLSLNADSTSTDTSFLRSPHWPVFKVGPAVFTSFIQRLISEAHPERCPEFVRDMMRHGIAPTVHHFTQVGGFYASVGDSRRAFMVMDTLETQHPRSVPESMVEKRSRGWRKGEEVPRPDVVFYTSLLRGFIISKRPDDALEVDRRFRKRYVYDRGQHPPLDDVYADLRRLQQDVTNQVYASHSSSDPKAER
ncbi:hypothetical protein D9615_005945 [Tricholomella constricta]|uniref:Uncharacterized protein n=1 Tax=Tricholomella constricta TaxID=117010 RepID=A0A8H5H976_9AGAR|nr:hypothetical protein D9615_005945 [Tricholomella constricta]